MGGILAIGFTLTDPYDLLMHRVIVRLPTQYR